MSRRVWWLCCGMVMLVGCATMTPDPVLVPALPVVAVPVDEPAPAAPMPAEDLGTLMDSEPRWVEGPPVQVAIAAAKRAMMRPALAGFDRGMLVYPYRPYAVYRVDVPIQGALHIQLQPGEVIRLVAGYRKSDWDVQRDDGDTSRDVSHLTVTPMKDAAYGRLVLITSWGVYYLDLHSQDGVGLFAVSWQHPGRVAR